MAGVRIRALAARGQLGRCVGKKERTRPRDVGGGAGRRCWAESGEGLGDARALSAAMLGEREVVEAVLRDCEDIAQHGERGARRVRAKNLPNPSPVRRNFGADSGVSAMDLFP